MSLRPAAQAEKRRLIKNTVPQSHPHSYLDRPTTRNKSTRRVAGVSGAYLVHAAVLEVSAPANAPDGALLAKLVRRRLSRLERVLAAHGGAFVRQIQQGLLASFDTAEAAVLGACEMQRRCAVIPQIAETRIALKIGIHPATSGLGSSSAFDPAEATAAKLATLLGEGGIVVSGTVFEALPATLREKTAPVSNDGAEMAAHAIDWDSIPMLPAPKVDRPPKIPETAKPPTAGLVLRQGGQTFRFGSGQSVITIGRDPANDIAISDPKASRKHCQIVNRLGSYVLVDVSLNGTYVSSGAGTEQLIKKNMATLIGSGQISFGHSGQLDSEHAFAFEIC